MGLPYVSIEEIHSMDKILRHNYTCATVVETGLRQKYYPQSTFVGYTKDKQLVVQLSITIPHCWAQHQHEQNFIHHVYSS